MYETQDMLPRLPPQPTQALTNEVTIKPTVPEVSIIFSKETPVTSTQNQKPISYAAWKKQVLPRVAFPPNLKENECNVPITSSVYPLRVSGPLTSSNTKRFEYDQLRSNTGIYTNAPVTAPGIGCQSQTRLLSTASLGNLNDVQTVPLSTGIYTNPSNFCTEKSSRHSLESAQAYSNVNYIRSLPVEDVLTICATTQTDAMSPNECKSDSIKTELAHLVSIVKQLKEEQCLMRQLMENLFLLKPQIPQLSTKMYLTDTGTQCEILSDNSNNASYVPNENNMPPSFDIEDGTMHKALPNTNDYNPTTKNTSRTVKPIAQSTTYRPMTPQNSKQTNSSNQQNTPNSASLPKPTTEKSMVMNELALKYLPNEKLNELLQNVQLTQGATVSTKITNIATPLREIDNFNKAPTDLSSASYKYLRKYRLLPDQHDRTPPQDRYNSPYQQRAQETPIIGPNGASLERQTESPHLDLEHIRRQPKFL